MCDGLCVRRRDVGMFVLLVFIFYSALIWTRDTIFNSLHCLSAYSFISFLSSWPKSFAFFKLINCHHFFLCYLAVKVIETLGIL